MKKTKHENRKAKCFSSNEYEKEEKKQRTEDITKSFEDEKNHKIQSIEEEKIKQFSSFVLGQESCEVLKKPKHLSLSCSSLLFSSSSSSSSVSPVSCNSVSSFCSSDMSNYCLPFNFSSCSQTDYSSKAHQPSSFTNFSSSFCASSHSSFASSSSRISSSSCFASSHSSSSRISSSSCFASSHSSSSRISSSSCFASSSSSRISSSSSSFSLSSSSSLCSSDFSSCHSFSYGVFSSHTSHPSCSSFSSSSRPHSLSDFPSSCVSSGSTSSSSSSTIADNLSELYCLYLRTIKDNWSSCHAARLLTPELLRYVHPRFHNCSTPLKVRILTSFLFLKPNMRENCKITLCKILRIGEVDSDEWVRKLSRILLPYISTGMIDLKETDTETVFRIISFLDEQKYLSMNAKVGGSNEYRLKCGLESVHLCYPYSSVTESNKSYEYELFSPNGNFELLLADNVKKGMEEMQIANGIRKSKN